MVQEAGDFHPDQITIPPLIFSSWGDVGDIGAMGHGGQQSDSAPNVLDE
jgi:hypothetical protein